MAPLGGEMTFPTSPVHENLFHRKTTVPLDFLVVGGSIGGLSTAYNLQQAGHRVRVLEKSDGYVDSRKYSGVRCPPNMTKLLLQWGLRDQLEEIGVKCPRVDFPDARTGEQLSSLVFHEEVMKELQAEMYNLHFVDLHKMILKLAVDSGVEVLHNSTVVDVDLNTPSVLLDSGERLTADIVIGADGPFSIVRECIVGRKEQHSAGPYSAYSYILPIRKIANDPELMALVKDGKWTCWVGPKRCALVYRIRKNEVMVQLVETNLEAAIGWDTLVPLSKLDFSAFEGRIQRLMSHATHAIETRHIVLEHLEEWSDRAGHAVLVGDAVHVLNPTTSHGAALAMEDGAVLGSLFSRLQSKSSEEIRRLLSAYQEIRQERCKVTLDSEWEKVSFSVLEEDDPLRKIRDAGFELARAQHSLDWTNVPESYLQGAWEEFKGSFGYEAYDAADDWWVDWGMVRIRLTAAAAAVGGVSQIALSGMETSANVAVVATTMVQ